MRYVGRCGRITVGGGAISETCGSLTLPCVYEGILSYSRRRRLCHYPLWRPFCGPLCTSGRWAFVCHGLPPRLICPRAPRLSLVHASVFFFFAVGGVPPRHQTRRQNHIIKPKPRLKIWPSLHANTQTKTARYLAEGYEEARRLWPSTPQVLGPYAGRPKPGDPTFDLLLNKIRVCPA